MKRLALFVTALMLSACGGGGSGGGVGTSGGTDAPPSSTQPTTPVQINLGDDPADRLIAANVTVNSVSLISAGGGSVAVLSTPRPMEMMRLLGTVAPLAMASVPRGSYAGAMITIGASTVTYVDAVTGVPVQRPVPGPMTTTVMFGSPLVVGTTPMVVNLDMNMAASVGIDAMGIVSMSPAMTARHNAAVAGSREPEDGGLHGLNGMVGSVGSTTFTLSMMQGVSGVALTTQAGTSYEGLAGMPMMGSNHLLSVDASLQLDGSWMATRVRSRVGAGGAMAAGVVTSLTGTPPTQLVLVMHDGTGIGMMASNLASTTTVNIGDATVFSIDARDVDLTNLPFTPRFDRATVDRGQRIEALSAGQMVQGGGMHGMMGGGTVTATSIHLGQQGLRGTVSGYAQAGAQSTFTLTLPADSAFARLTGSTTVTVYQQGSTRLRGVSGITNGSMVQVRGLVFRDGAAVRLVAGRILGV
ncbi:MAG TPA: DUF5666 domain-containing protein [Burkholderiaceae bacterium]|nr:DUF5666 domain-containing protein [Burkholderiaceae bacterium]